MGVKSFFREEKTEVVHSKYKPAASSADIFVCAPKAKMARSTLKELLPSVCSNAFLEFSKISKPCQKVIFFLFKKIIALIINSGRKRKLCASKVPSKSINKVFTFFKLFIDHLNRSSISIHTNFSPVFNFGSNSL